MSFTQDELQALNSILDQKMVVLLRELVRFFDQRMQILRQEFEQHQQRLEESIEQAFAAQLPVIEQLINQRFSASNSPVSAMYTDQSQASIEAIEVQTEIPWEDLIDLMSKALNERFITFNTSLQAQLQDIEHEVSSQIQLLRNDLRKQQPLAALADTSSAEAEMQDILTSVHQLERIVESMQVAMAANSTLISKRLSHHQRLSIEQAHPSRSFSPTEHERSKEREEDLPPFSPS
ncbi:MAG: hypothetical protein E6J34_20570 [Chloroflexi bacterium]|nr:MAG: hypothetical protein E6J34_20570 [Chloroflexota bacterium]